MKIIRNLVMSRVKVDICDERSSIALGFDKLTTERAFKEGAGAIVVFVNGLRITVE